MAKLPLFLLVFFVVVFYSAFIYLKNVPSEPPYRPGNWPEADKAINQATYLYQQKKLQKVDLTNGPCLSNAIQPGWVADLVHNPRLPDIDDQPANQCSAYQEGIKHLVELDLDGNLVRVK